MPRSETPAEQLTDAQKSDFAVRRAQSQLLTLERKINFLRKVCRDSNRLPVPLELDSIRATLIDLERLTRKS